MTHWELEDLKAEENFEISRERFLNGGQFVEDKEEKVVNEDEWRKKYLKELNEKVEKELNKIKTFYY